MSLGRGSRLFAGLDHIHSHRRDDEDTGDNFKDVVADLKTKGTGLTGVLDDRHQQSTDKGAGNGAASASQGSTADNGCGDGVHVIALASVRHGAEDTAREHHSGNAVDQAGRGVDHVEGLAHLDAGQAGDFDTGADDEEVTAKDGIAQDQEGNDGNKGPDTGEDGEKAENVVVADI